MQNCRISSASAMEILQFGTEPSMMMDRWKMDNSPLRNPLWSSSPIHINGLVQDCSNSSANALELLQSCTKPSIWSIRLRREYHRTEIRGCFNIKMLFYQYRNSHFKDKTALSLWWESYIWKGSLYIHTGLRILGTESSGVYYSVYKFM